MVDKEIFSRISRRIDSHIDDMIKLQTDLTALPALAPESGGDGEYRKAQFLIDHLRSMGVKDIDEFNAADKRVSSGVRPNIVATIPGKNPDRTVWILTHTDIVPPGELEFWDDDPYKGYVKDGRIYGRGTEDNQQDLVASLFAAGAFIEEEIMPESNIGLVFVADEETGSIKGLEHLLKMKKAHSNRRRKIQTYPTSIPYRERMFFIWIPVSFPPLIFPPLWQKYEKWPTK
jgi:succinyl-diaminopimelate desuccinylase